MKIEMNLTPISFEKFKHRGMKSYRGLSINRNGYIMLSKIAEGELGISDRDYVAFAKSGIRWFIRKSHKEEKNAIIACRYNNKSMNLKLSVGKFFIAELLKNFDFLEKKNSRLYFSTKTIFNNGGFWYELLGEDPNK